MKLHVAAPIVAAVLSLCAGAACASTASATLTNFHIELFDLNKGNGIAPWVTFQNFQGGTFVAAETGTSDAHGNFVRSTDLQAGGTPFGGALASSAMGSSAAFAAFAGDPFEAGANVSTFVSSSQFGTYGASTVMLGDGGDYVSFTLSPETRMVISADASTAATSTVDDPYADAWASAYLKLTDYTGADQVSYSNASAEQGSTLGANPYTSSDDQHLEVSFENLGTDSVDGLFFGSVDANASDIAPPTAVPEPATGALMLAALGLFGWAGRRRGAVRR